MAGQHAEGFKFTLRITITKKDEPMIVSGTIWNEDNRGCEWSKEGLKYFAKKKQENLQWFDAEKQAYCSIYIDPKNIELIQLEIKKVTVKDWHDWVS